MNWVDCVAVGAVLLIVAGIVAGWLVRRRRGQNDACAGCPYADGCARGQEPARKRPMDCPRQEKGPCH